MSKAACASRAALADRKRDRRLLGLISLGLGAVSLLSLLFVGSASALVNSKFFQELPTIDQHAATDFIYEQSPQGTVPYTGEASEISESVSHTYESQVEAQPVYGEIAGETNSLEEDVELIPEVNEAVPELYAVDGSFLAGWKIGEGVDALFAEIGLGPDSAPEESFAGSDGFEFCYSAKCGAHLEWYPYEESRPVEKPGAYLYDAHLSRYHGENWGNWFPVAWEQAPCPFSDFSLPPYSSLAVVETESECSNGGESYPLNEVFPYVPAQKILSLHEFHLYNAITDPKPNVVSKAPENPGAAAVEEKASERLDESELVQAYLTQAEEAEPGYEYFPAPTATEKRVDDEERRCDRGTPTFDNLGGNESPEPFAKRESTAFTIGTLPEAAKESAPVYLRYGETFWKGPESPGEPEYMDNWGGWGYRHIAAKHGWTPLDRLETEEALALALPKNSGRGTWIYESLDSTPGGEGVKCTRRVVVDFVQKEGNPAPRGIVSSYNVVGEPEE